ncbi:uncharacterized protein EV154DRAFT_411623 [Mucor mucedo]|uniref:uncharacterized protein n=1 Tax=Mucor mucedo TaxID=29922 RepID=UPI00221E55D9|nr:uncharacterized protein EV154DRAFT_411623 [Mucor mucedo]KAI7896397.1 hypothetical protein EV154DRAFT_411623 [Mucor mucedo]
MLSVTNMLNYKQQHYKRPAVLDISNLLNTPYQPKSPSLSPSLTSSPASINSFTSYPFPTQQAEWQDAKHRSHTPINDDDESSAAIKAKRRRANAKQLEVLNRVFDRTFFPSTQMRAELGRQLGMSPRTVQIWFQNRRQAMRTRERQRLIRLRNNDSKQTTTE